MTGFEVHQTPMIEQIKHSRCRRVNSAAGFRGTLLTQNRHAKKNPTKAGLVAGLVTAYNWEAFPLENYF